MPWHGAHGSEDSMILDVSIGELSLDHPFAFCGEGIHRRVRDTRSTARSAFGSAKRSSQGEQALPEGGREGGDSSHDASVRWQILIVAASTRSCGPGSGLADGSGRQVRFMAILKSRTEDFERLA
jgi:hypothetical protein